jgi:5-methylthioadenosine/S-adenosylhomocysteine deaminase
MTGILLRHADVITLDTVGNILHDADVAIEDGRIVGVGAAPDGFQPAETVDAVDHVVLPGFVNAHTHSAMTLFRGWAEELLRERWFNERAWMAETSMTADDVYWGAALAAAEMIRGGTTAFADQYFYMDRVGEVVVESGLRANLAWCAFGRAEGEIGTDLPGIAAFVEDWQGAGDGRVRTSLGPHSPYLCSPQFLARSAAVAVRLGAGMHIHAAETQAQMQNSILRDDLTPIEILDRNGVFDVQALVAHGIYLSDADISILAAKHASVVQCATSQMKLGLGLTRAPELAAGGVNVALGTDSPATNTSLSMLQEARQAVLGQRLLRADPGALAGDLALRMATQNGARALGFPACGCIAPGYSADLVLIDCARARLAPRHDLVANVLFSAQDGDISDVMVSGRWLMRRGSLLTLDEERIRAEAERRAFLLVG